MPIRNKIAFKDIILTIESLFLSKLKKKAIPLIINKIELELLSC